MLYDDDLVDNSKSALETLVSSFASSPFGILLISFRYGWECQLVTVPTDQPMYPICQRRTPQWKRSKTLNAESRAAWRLRGNWALCPVLECDLICLIRAMIETLVASCWVQVRFREAFS